MTEVGESVSVVSAPPEDEKKCEYCKKDEHDFADSAGTNVGNSGALRRNIIKDIKAHKWYTGGWSLAAHHLICSESMDDDDWSTYCIQFGYNVNHQNNGVMLPSRLKNACQLYLPLHRGNHEKGKAEGVSYPDKIKSEISEFKADVKSGKYCDNPKGLVDKLDEFSEKVVKKVDKFKWTLTADGKDYKSGGNGCSGVTSISGKPNTACPCDRLHGLTKKNGTAVIPKNTSALIVGK